jgi:hypothetical protein
MLRKRWFRWAVISAAILLLASEGFSLLLRTAASRRYLTARLESSFGRPVEVRTFSFSLLDGPRIEAFDVSVAEDPRFGQEYFLRAEQLTAGPRWSALLTGHFEFSTLSFTNPTLNLVRLADGHWNLESWLPSAATATGNRAAAAAPRTGLRFHLSRIEVDSGRINFKQGEDVRPFAFEDVTGYLDQDTPGRWLLDFQTQPVRPGVAQPQSGMLRLRGLVGGTSSRLQPADLDLSIWDASIEDALRLVRGQDYGIRGALSADLHASIEPPSPGVVPNPAVASPAEWSVTGVVRLADIHRWDLTSKPGEPAVNVSLNARWRSGEDRVALASCDVQAPASILHTSGELEWNHGFHPRLSLASSDIAYDDLLAWYRALRAGVDDNLSVKGWFRAEGSIEDWPPHVLDASLESSGAQIVPSTPLAPLLVSRWNASLHGSSLDSSLVVFQFAPAPGAAVAIASRQSALKIQASLILPQPGRAVSGRLALSSPAPAHPAPETALRFRASVDGAADRVQDYLALSRQFGHPTSPLWSAEGALIFHLHAEGAFRPRSTDWQGSIESKGLTLQFAFLNQPLRLSVATLALGSGGAQELTLTFAQAFDAAWTGTISRTPARPGWQFDLTADRLDAVALDRWLEPRTRPAGLFARLGLFGAGQSGGENLSAAVPVVPISARGRLRVAEFSLAPFRFTQMDADIELAGRTIDVHRAKGLFAGGTVEGQFTAALGAQPAYDVRARFDRVDLAALAAGAPSLAGRFGGAAAGEVSLHATGIGRDALLDSLEGQGSIAARNVQFRGFDLGALQANASSPDAGHFAEAQALFRIADRTVRAAPVQLTRPGEDLVAAGGVDFDGTLDFRIDASGPQATPPRASHATSVAERQASPSSAFRLSGSVAAPHLGPFVAPAAPANPGPRAVRGAPR